MAPTRAPPAVLLLFACVCCLQQGGCARIESNTHGQRHLQLRSLQQNVDFSQGDAADGAAPAAAAPGGASSSAALGAAPANTDVLQNAKVLAWVADRMYRFPYGISDPQQSSYSDCARQHAPANELQRATAAALAGKLGTQAANVAFFDLNFAGLFCHAALTYVPAGAAHGLALPRPSEPVVVVSFRGSDNLASFWADIQGIITLKLKFRGQQVQLHRGFTNSVLKQAPPASCAGLRKPTESQPSCGESLKGAIDALIKQHKLSAPVQVFVTGHSLGAAEAAVFALFLDDNNSNDKYDIWAYNTGQPMIGLGPGLAGGAGFRDVYGRLNDKTFRVVHNADPIPAQASSCLLPMKRMRPYEHVGTMLRVVSQLCAKNINASQPGEERPAGQCAELVTGSVAKCTLQPPSWKDVCSMWVGQGSSGAADKCYCSQQMGSLLALKLWNPVFAQAHNLWGAGAGDHNSNDTVNDLESCQGLDSIPVSAALPLDSTCSSGYTVEDICFNVTMTTA